MSALFVVAGAIAVLAAVGVVLAKSPIHSVMSLVLNIVAMAALFLSLQAEFLAVIQIIIYAGAIMILFLFVIALLTSRIDPIERPKSSTPGQDLVAAAVGLASMGLLGVTAFLSKTPAAGRLPEDYGSTGWFGLHLLTTHVLAFELTAFVLMIAVVGVVILVGRREA